MIYPCKLLILDFDGTLGDTSAIILATYQDTLSALGLPAVTEREGRATIGLPLKECYRQMLGHVPEDVLDNCVNTHHRLFELNSKHFSPQLFPGVKATLEQLHRQGIMLTVASSRGHESLCRLLSCCGVLPLFSLILGAEDVERAKPDPFPVLLTLRQTGVDAADAVVVGDMPVDIIMGRNAGCRTVAVDYGNASHEELLQAGPTTIISHFGDLLA